MVLRSDVAHLDEEIVTGINNITSISQILTKPDPRSLGRRLLLQRKQLEYIVKVVAYWTVTYVRD